MKRKDIARSVVGKHGRRYVPFDSLTTDEKITRWQGVLRVLESLTPEQRKDHFNMEGFFAEPRMLPKKARKIAEPCGTVACAAGWCAMDPEFKRQGFFAKPRLNVGKDYFAADTHISTFELFSATDWNPNASPWAFFGDEGTDNIFHDATKRSVECVIMEVKRYLMKLERDRIDEKIDELDDALLEMGTGK